MRAGRNWSKRAAEPEADVERTAYVPVVDVDDAAGGVPLIEQPDPEASDAAFADELLGSQKVVPRTQTSGGRVRRRVGRVMLGVACVLIVLFAVYVADLLTNLGDVPRGVSVAGVAVGGLPQQEAEAKLRRVLGSRLTDPVQIRAGDMRAELEPADAGLRLNWAATLQKAGMQPLNPISRVLSFFTTREVDVVSTVDMRALRAAVSTLADERLNHPPTEGRVDFEPARGAPGSVHAFAVEPRHGQQLADVAQAARTVADNWLRPKPITLDVRVEQVRATSAGVHATLKNVVRPMVSAPVTVQGKDTEAVIEPATIADSLSFSPRKNGSLRVDVDRSVLQDDVRPELQGTERTPESARFAFTGSHPSIRSGREGRSIDWAATFGSFTDVAQRGKERVLPVAYQTVAPEVSTGDLKDLQIDEAIGEYSVDVPSGPAQHNVATMAEDINGALVRPDETFRLNDYTGPRTGAQGYLPAPVQPGSDTVVSGGGVAPLTTALYNATYLAGLKDAGHTAHHVYDERFPAARDAVSLSPDGAPEPMAFTNDTPTGVLVRAEASGGQVTVTLWGTEHYRVESKTSDRTDVEPPPVEHDPDEGCEPRDGAPGFTVSDTRVVYDAESGDEVRRGTSTTTYEPRPKVVCHAT